jgi:hypothetical protein
MKLTLSALKKIVRKVISPGSNSELDPHALKGMVRGIVTTRPDEIGCDECFEQLDRFVEVTLAGKNAAEAMPLVQDHLDRCDDCREEFEALLAALEAAG